MTGRSVPAGALIAAAPIPLSELLATVDLPICESAWGRP